MSSLIKASIKTSELKKIDANKIVKGEKDNYIPITISVDDESRYGQNVSIYIEQTKEEREAKNPRQYIANGSVIWTDGKIVKGQREVLCMTQIGEALCTAAWLSAKETFWFPVAAVFRARASCGKHLRPCCLWNRQLNHKLVQ